MYFTDVGANCYIQTEAVKYVMSAKKPLTKAAINLIKKAIESLKMLDLARQKVSLSIVVLEDNTVLRSPVESSEIVNRLQENGNKFYTVDTDYYISVSYIKAISDVSSLMAASVRKVNSIANNDYQMVRHRDSLKTLILMKTGESICVNKNSIEIVQTLEKQINSPNNLQKDRNPI